MSVISPPTYPSQEARPPFVSSGPPLSHLPPPTVPPTVPPGGLAPPGGPPPPTAASPPKSPPASGPWAGGGRIKRGLLLGLALALIGGSLAIDRSGLVVVPVLFLLVVPFEKLFPRHSQKLRRPQVGTDIGYALAGPLLSVAGIVVAVVVAVISLAWLPGLALRPLVGMLPPAVAPFVGIALFDLAIYWTHRWYHEVPVLWRFHSIHHSPDHMDWISGFRNHPLDGTLIAPAFIFLLAAGFSPEFTGVLAIVQFVLGIFLHANVRFRLRPLHRLVITPEFHHWHHANEPGAINSNYSVFLPAWDMLFGTYFMPRNRRPQVYGVSEHIPVGMVAQLWHPLRGMGNPLLMLLHPIRSIKAGFRFTKRLLGDMKRSAARPRRRSREDFGPTPTRSSAPMPMPAPMPPTSGPGGRTATAVMPPPPGTAIMATPTAQPAGTVPMPYSPYFAAPEPDVGATRPFPGATATEVYLQPKSLAEIMDWDRPGHRQ